MSAITEHWTRWITALFALALVLALLVSGNQDTAQAIDPADTDTVYIADGTNYADALMGATIAALNTSPMLGVAGTNGGDTIPGDTVEELDRLTNNKASPLDTIYIFGGTSAVSANVATQLEAWATNVERIAGNSRWGTYEAISQMLPAKIKDSDLLDGLDSTSFANAGHDHDASYVNTSGDTMTGDLTVPSVKYSSPREHVLSIPHQEFATDDDGHPFTGFDSRGASGDTGTHSIFAPVVLPDGATVTGLECVFYDASAADTIRCLLRASPMLLGNVDGMGSVDSSGDGGFQRIVDDFFTPFVVDNSANIYYMQVGPISGTWSGTDTTIKAVLVTYTLDEAP